MPLSKLGAPETKFSVVPDRLLDSIIDDAIAAAVGRLNVYLPDGVSIDITSIDLTPIRDELRADVADRLTETAVPVNPNDPVISSILARYAEQLNGFLVIRGKVGTAGAPLNRSLIWLPYLRARSATF